MSDGKENQQPVAGGGGASAPAANNSTSAILGTTGQSAPGGKVQHSREPSAASSPPAKKQTPSEALGALALDSTGSSSLLAAVEPPRGRDPSTHHRDVTANLLAVSSSLESSGSKLPKILASHTGSLTETPAVPNLEERGWVGHALR